MRTLKKILIAPMKTKARTTRVGTVDHWNIIDPRKKIPFVIAAGVGQNISFELELANRWNANLILLDPSPTGISTIGATNIPKNIRFLPLGLASNDGIMHFAEPANADEGSYSIARKNDVNTITFDCISLKSLINREGIQKIDILKMDVEGFEYKIIDQIISDQIKIDQICIEIHVNRTSGANASILDAAVMMIRLFMNGYRIIYNEKMDFTFAHRSFLSANPIFA